MAVSDSDKIKNDVYLTAQQNLISTLLLMPDKSLDVVSMLDADDFGDTSCNIIFKAIQNMVSKNEHESIAVDTVQIELEKEGNLVAAGGPQKLLDLYNNRITAASKATVETYACLIKDVSVKRKTKNVLSQIDPYLTIDSGVTARNAIEKTQNELTDLSGHLETSKMSVDIGEYYDTFIDDLEKRKQIYRDGGNELEAAGGIPTGFPTLDKKLHGWQKGNTIVVGARTGIGKSVCAVDFAVAAAQANASVLFFSMEMTIKEIATRFVAHLSGVSMNKIISGSLSDEESERVAKIKEDIKKLKIRVDTSQDSTVENIRSKSSKLAQSDTGLDLVIIDYLGLIKYNGKAKDKQNQIAEISRSLKEMAMVMNIPVIILAQLDNRLRGEEAEEEPTLAHIRESGAIANDSNVIILLHRKKNDENNDFGSAKTKFIIEKNRGGDKGSFMCNSLLYKAKFTEVEVDESGASDPISQEAKKNFANMQNDGVISDENDEVNSSERKNLEAVSRMLESNSSVQLPSDANDNNINNSSFKNSSPHTSSEKEALVDDIFNEAEQETVNNKAPVDDKQDNGFNAASLFENFDDYSQLGGDNINNEDD